MIQSVSKKSLIGVLVAAIMCVALLVVAVPQDAHAAQGWNKNSKGWWYEYDSKGNYYKNGWKYIAEQDFWYYFQGNGYAKTGWLKDGNAWYYFHDRDNAMHEPPFMVSSTNYQIYGTWYHFKANGAMSSSCWIKCWDGCWEYANPSGDLATGWKKISGKWYYFGIPDTKYEVYSQANVWKSIGGSWYYFDEDSAMAYSEWREGYWLNADGTWTYKYKGSWHKDSKGWWFGDESGWYAKNTSQWIDGKKYNFNSAGYCTNP